MKILVAGVPLGILLAVAGILLGKGKGGASKRLCPTCGRAMLENMAACPFCKPAASSPAPMPAPAPAAAPAPGPWAAETVSNPPAPGGAMASPVATQMQIDVEGWRPVAGDCRR